MVTSVTSLGKNGLYDWLIQRATAIVLAVYALCLTSFLLCNPDLTYADWHAYMTSGYMKVFSVIALLSIAAHGWVGIWSISTDYLTERQMGAMGTPLRLAFQGLCAVLTLVYLIWGIQILWGL